MTEPDDLESQDDGLEDEPVSPLYRVIDQAGNDVLVMFPEALHEIGEDADEAKAKRHGDDLGMRAAHLIADAVNNLAAATKSRQLEVRENRYQTLLLREIALLLARPGSGTASRLHNAETIIYGQPLPNLE